MTTTKRATKRQRQESKKYFQNQLRELIRQAEGTPGYLTLASVSFLSQEINQFYDLAYQKYKEGDTMYATEISCTILEEITRALGFTDDSKGDIAKIIDKAFNLIADIAAEDISDELRTYLFEYSASAFRKMIFSGWNWHFRIIDLALFLARGDKDIQKILSLLEKDKSLNREEANHIRLQIIRKTKNEGEADHYVEENLSLTLFRTELIEKCIRDGDFDRAKELANEGLKQDAKERPGLIYKWYDFLLRIALEEKDHDRIIEYARFLLIEPQEENKKYYQILKKNIPSDKWPAFVEDLIYSIGNKKRWSDFSLIAQIYIREKMWDQLFLHIRRNLQLSYLEYYEEYLRDFDLKQLYELYEEAILNDLRSDKEKRSYHDIAYFIGRLKNLGGSKESQALVDKLRKLYPEREELIEELDKIA